MSIGDIMKILVVHPNPKVVDQLLAKLGRELAIKHHTSGLDGLFTSRLEKFDLIICGTELPIVTGYELIRAVRTYSVNRQTPVIFLADEVDEKAEKLGHALGVASLLGSQDTPSQLPTLVDEQFSQWLQQHETSLKQRLN
ncbi:MAG: response regulator [Bacteroidota bacterium]